MTNIDPLFKAFKVQKSNARQRRIPWHFKYWEWLQLWQESGHLHERGVNRGQYVMARKGDAGPYTRENVTIIPAEQNNSVAQLTKKAKRAGSP